MSNSDFRAPTTWTGSLASIRAWPQVPGDVAPGPRQITRRRPRYRRPDHPSDGQVHRNNTQRRDSALGGHPPSAVCDEPNVVDPIRHVLVDPMGRAITGLPAFEG
jgi:hypothetical protein